MDRTNDCILGVLGTQWERTRPGGVETYLSSIKRSGFCGRKIMIVWDIHPTTRQMLVNHGFELVNVPIPNEPFFIARMRVCWEYLRDHCSEFRYIFWLDVKDLLIQNDLSSWMESNVGDKKIVASNECVNISQEETNKLWAQSILGEERYQEIKDCEVINGGTWAGESATMTEVFRRVYVGCRTYAGGFPPCQIWINYVMHAEMKDLVYIPRWSKGFAACLHPCWSPWRVPCWPNMKDNHPVIDASTCSLYSGAGPNLKNPMMVFNPDWGNDRRVQMAPYSHPLEGVECSPQPEGALFSVVHGYDRDWDMKALFEFKYSRESLTTLKEFLEYNESSIRNSARLYASPHVQQRPLRRTVVVKRWSKV